MDPPEVDRTSEGVVNYFDELPTTAEGEATAGRIQLLIQELIQQVDPPMQKEKGLLAQSSS